MFPPLGILTFTPPPTNGIKAIAYDPAQGIMDVEYAASGLTWRFAQIELEQFREVVTAFVQLQPLRALAIAGRPRSIDRESGLLANSAARRAVTLETCPGDMDSLIVVFLDQGQLREKRSRALFG